MGRSLEIIVASCVYAAQAHGLRNSGQDQETHVVNVQHPQYPSTAFMEASKHPSKQQQQFESQNDGTVDEPRLNINDLDAESTITIHRSVREF